MEGSIVEEVSMWSVISSLRLAGLIGLVSASLGCSLWGHGRLDVNWRIEGDTDVSRCDDYDAAELAIRLYDWTGDPYTTETVNCERFDVTLRGIPEGDYEVRAEMIDYSGDSVSDEKSEDVTIDSFETTRIVFRFEESDFTAGP
jgi:hypothetical protein